MSHYTQILYETTVTCTIMCRRRESSRQKMPSPCGSCGVEFATPIRLRAHQQSCSGSRATLPAAARLVDWQSYLARHPDRTRETDCWALAVAYALQQAPAALPDIPALQRPCTLWLIGARMSAEGQAALAGGFDLLPELFSGQWTVVLIGPEMEAGPPVARPGGLTIERVQSTLHEYMCFDPTPPHLLVCFNSGIGTLTPPVMTTWLPTVAEMLAMNVPLLLTCYSKLEVQGENGLLRGHFKAHNLSDPGESNPFAHTLDAYKASAYSEMMPGEVCSINSFFWWLRGSQYAAEQLTGTIVPYILRQVRSLPIQMQTDTSH